MDSFKDFIESYDSWKTASPYDDDVDCPACEGTGKQDDVRCEFCKGEGVVSTSTAREYYQGQRNF